MKMLYALNGLTLLFSAAAFNTQAALVSFTGVGGVGLVYSSVSDVTWTQDANLFKTMYDADNSLVSRIIDLGPIFNDPARISQTVHESDFDTSNGRMNWWGAKGFAIYLNSINYGGSSQWRLPNSNAIQGFDRTAGNEFGQLFFSELDGKAGFSLPDTGFFNNEQFFAYWTNREGIQGSPDLGLKAWVVVTEGDGVGGLHYTRFKFYQYYAWLVSPGEVAAVPVPGAVWLFGSGLAGWLGLKRRAYAGRRLDR